MTPQRYRLSFTTGGLFLQVAPLVAEHYLVIGNWESTRNKVRSNNLLQVRTSTAATRLSKELISRLELLSLEELKFLTVSNRREQGYMLWSAACRRYAFIHDFAVNILREYFLTLRLRLTSYDFDTFVNSKAVWHVELDEIASSTLYRLRQNLFLMLREADLLSEEGLIQPAMFTPQLVKLFSIHHPESLNIFPASETDIKRWLQ